MQRRNELSITLVDKVVDRQEVIRNIDARTTNHGDIEVSTSSCKCGVKLCTEVGALHKIRG